MGRGSADGTKSGTERQVWKFDKGALLEQRKSGRAWRRSLQGEAKAGQSCSTGQMLLALSWVYEAKAKPAGEVRK